jgi:molybdopterin converting factor small subunit
LGFEVPRVTIEINSWLTGLLHNRKVGETGGILWEQEISEGDTLLDVLKTLAASEKKIGESLFHEDSGRLTDQISIAINHRFIHLLDGPDTKLRDGDSIILFQAWSGG